ncbi:2Fe-2S iron-sulfur cluster-binding protein [Streptomyces sp. NPDC089919]|uniref:2Fe-2S iron-sulfur cluster-binding protein n=1 Tax=Streptomyces sp. NPDC089919 TaxID=3155188 RepID=UPI0034275B44
MSENDNATGAAPGAWGWQPVPQGGDYDADATAFVKLPEEMLGEPLEAPGHGYVPPVIVTTAPASTDPSATGTWSVPTDWAAAAAPAGPGWAEAAAPAAPAVPSWADGAPAAAAASAPAPAPAEQEWPEAAPAQHGDTAEWHFPDAGASLTGQWSIPVAEGDLPEESGEYARSTLAPEWAQQAPATLPGGAAAPWAEPLQQWPAPSPEDRADAAVEHTEGAGQAFDGVRGYVAPPADYTGTAVRLPGADDWPHPAPGGTPDPYALLPDERAPGHAPHAPAPAAGTDGAGFAAVPGVDGGTNGAGFAAVHGADGGRGAGFAAVPRAAGDPDGAGFAGGTGPAHQPSGHPGDDPGTFPGAGHTDEEYGSGPAGRTADADAAEQGPEALPAGTPGLAAAHGLSVAGARAARRRKSGAAVRDEDQAFTDLAGTAAEGGVPHARAGLPGDSDGTGLPHAPAPGDGAGPPAMPAGLPFPRTGAPAGDPHGAFEGAGDGPAPQAAVPADGVASGSAFPQAGAPAGEPHGAFGGAGDGPAPHAGVSGDGVASGSAFPQAGVPAGEPHGAFEGAGDGLPPHAAVADAGDGTPFPPAAPGEDGAPHGAAEAEGPVAAQAQDAAEAPQAPTEDADGLPHGPQATAEERPAADAHPAGPAGHAAVDLHVAADLHDAADLHAPAEAPPGPGAAVAQDEHPHASYVLRVNGADRPVTGAWIGESLLYVLRERLGLAGAKDGCSQGECGACAVQVDGRLVASCLVPAATAAGSEVRTVEGLAQGGELSDVQQALCRSGAVQCGFCVPGMAMTIHDLLEGNHAPTELETRQALCGNLCRCSGYQGVLGAVREVVAEREETAAAQAEAARIPHQAPPGAGGIHHDGGMA